jgi:hypothetical protein
MTRVRTLSHYLRSISPPQLYINSIQIGYNIFLSFLGNKKVDDSEELKAAAK